MWYTFKKSILNLFNIIKQCDFSRNRSYIENFLFTFCTRQQNTIPGIFFRFVYEYLQNLISVALLSGYNRIITLFYCILSVVIVLFLSLSHKTISIIWCLCLLRKSLLLDLMFFFPCNSVFYDMIELRKIIHTPLKN